MATRREIRFFVRIGSVDISAAVRDGNIIKSINERPSASLSIESTAQVMATVDLTASVQIDDRQSGRRIFTGSVVKVTHSNELSTIYCETGTELVGRPSSVVTCFNCEIELIYSIVTVLGVKSDIDGLSESLDTFEVVAPVADMRVERSIEYGATSLIPRSDAMTILGSMEHIPQEFRDWCENFDAFGIARLEEVRMHDAQELGLRLIAEMISRLVVVSRYSLFKSVNGKLTDWSSGQKNFNPERAHAVIVRSTDSSRYWVQRLRLTPYPQVLNADKAPLSELASAAGDESSPLSKRQAFVYCAAAARPVGAPDRVTALWQAIEFFVGKYKVEKLFNSEAKDLIKAVVEEKIAPFLTATQSARLDEVLGELNTPGLPFRFKHYIKACKVPVSIDEMDLLDNLRKYRNDINHGREPAPPTRDEIDRGVSIVSRILLWPFGENLGATESG